jgi:hypothetical protein
MGLKSVLIRTGERFSSFSTNAVRFGGRRVSNPAGSNAVTAIFLNRFLRTSGRKLTMPGALHANSTVSSPGVP